MKDFAPNYSITTFFLNNELRLTNIINYQKSIMFGLSKEKLIGRSLKEIEANINGDDTKLIKEIIEVINISSIENRNIYHEYKHKTSQNVINYVIMLTRPNKNGNICVNFICIDEKDIFNKRYVFSKDLLRSATECIDTGICIKKYGDNRKHGYLVINSKLKEYFGCKPNEKIENSIFWSENEDFQNDILTTEKGGYYVFDKILKDNNGDIIKWLQVHKTQSFSRSVGYYIVSTFVDITDIKKLQLDNEKLSSRYMSLFKNLPIGVGIYNKDGIMIDINDMQCEILGVLDKKDIIGISLWENENISDKDKMAIKNGNLYNNIIKYDFNLVSKKSYYKTSKKGLSYLRCRYNKIARDSELDGYIVCIEDITKEYLNDLALEELSRNLDLALDAGSVSAWIYDVNMKMFKTLRGKVISGEGLSLIKASQLFHKDDLETLNSIFDSLISIKEHNQSSIFRILSDDNTYHYYESKMSSNIVNNKVISITGTQKDITDNIMIQEELKVKNNSLKLLYEENLAILENIPIGVAVYQANGEQSFSNKATADIFGLKSADEYFKKNISLFDIPNIPKEFINKIRKGEDYNIVYGYDLTKGHPEITDNKISNILYLDIKVRYVKKSNGEIEKIIILIEDITKSKTYEKSLKEERTKAQQADKLKSAFLANMSHEIRTPLNSIVGFSELLQSAETEEEKEEYVKIISNNNDLLLRLINDILDLAKIESGTVNLEYEHFDLSDLFNKTYASLKLKSSKPNLEFIMNNPYSNCDVFLDKNRVQQILTNYITNAIKYTKSGTITMGYSKLDNGIKIYVKDTGIGIAKENHHLVFDRFQKFDSFAQGTGLGLAINKVTSEAMGGKIGFESKKDVGSLFWAWLPTEIILSNKVDLK